MITSWVVLTSAQLGSKWLGAQAPLPATLPPTGTCTFKAAATCTANAQETCFRDETVRARSPRSRSLPASSRPPLTRPSPPRDAQCAEDPPPPRPWTPDGCSAGGVLTCRFCGFLHFPDCPPAPPPSLPSPPSPPKCDGCSWTLDYACPGEMPGYAVPGRKGIAKADGSECFNFCCVSPPPSLPSPPRPPPAFALNGVFDGEIEAASTERRLAHTELLRAFAIDGDAAGGDEELEVLSMHSPRDGGGEVADWKTVVQTVGSRPPDTGPGWSMPRRAALPPARTSPPSLLDASPTAPADAEPAGGDGSSDVSCSSAMSNQLGTHVSAIKNLYK
ncbi:hypothetical protein EMIHUDRAFT_95940 [Emiliania huxleyi CCMP1516]|uniref:Pherophorin domain-containing protein n=2 Tax=Emiliania huxleyi TaxID=2903 RepID=A0A0D3J3Q4_EMIH1|nr:hypothetical protein EMIHUDRAFT_95940 [Emiliania huxleyi CCMP1516]EOD18139.1 hypothetical protein EMIHUDRAFT_95940 [Emiliania huxleyi CCMP1516]|eukprot:XP_005770568.1 hypothetical protein EMIHUDRAFT_95940 [Emiliania huxleyi CCMP1516]